MREKGSTRRSSRLREKSLTGPASDWGIFAERTARVAPLLRRLRPRIHLVGRRTVQGSRRGPGKVRQVAARQTDRPEKDNDDIIGDPIGREALLDELAHEMIPYTPEELIEIANKEFAWCEAEIKKAAAELGYGDDWQQGAGAREEASTSSPASSRS